METLGEFQKGNCHGCCYADEGAKSANTKIATQARLPLEVAQPGECSEG